MTQQPKFEEFRELADQPSAPPPNKHWGILIISLVGVALVAYLLFGRRPPKTEVIEAVIVGEEATRVPINNAEVVDASSDRTAVAREGYRYKVRIEDESSDGVAGVTHIGGLVTFVPDARPGEMVIVEVTRLKERTADAMVIKRLPAETIAWTPRPPRPTRPPMFTPDGIYTSVVTEIGKKGDAIIKVNGKVVFLPGAQPGDRVTFRVVEERDSAATGEVLTREPGPVPAPSTDSRRQPAMTRPPLFTPDQVCTSVVTEIGKKGDAITKINGKVVFLPGAQPGDRVVFRIVSERDSAATGEVLTREPGPVPSSPASPEAKPLMFQPDQVVTGKVTDIGKKGDGLTRIGGKVVFLPGTQVGDEVVFRVVSERDSTARGEVISRTPAAP